MLFENSQVPHQFHTKRTPKASEWVAVMATTAAAGAACGIRSGAIIKCNIRRVRFNMMHTYIHTFLFICRLFVCSLVSVCLCVCLSIMCLIFKSLVHNGSAPIAVGTNSLFENACWKHAQ